MELGGVGVGATQPPTATLSTATLRKNMTLYSVRYLNSEHTKQESRRKRRHLDNAVCAAHESFSNGQWTKLAQLCHADGSSTWSARRMCTLESAAACRRTRARALRAQEIQGLGVCCGAQHHAPQSYTSSKFTECVSSTSTKKVTLQPSACHASGEGVSVKRIRTLTNGEGV